jgi:hypothetical protein
MWYFGMFRQCGILECSDSVVFCNVPTVWYFGMFRPCGILLCSDSVVFWNVPTVWYFGMFRQCGILECSDSVVFWNVPTVWYFYFLFYFNHYLFNRKQATWVDGRLDCGRSWVRTSVGPDQRLIKLDFPAFSLRTHH